MYIHFDPTGTGEHYDPDRRVDLWEGEPLSRDAHIPFRSKRIDVLPWDKWGFDLDLYTEDQKKHFTGPWKGWENVLITMVGNRILATYDLPNFVAYPGAEPVWALRGVFIEAN